MPEIIRRTPIGAKPIASKPVQRDRLSPHQFAADPARYATMPFRRCGRSGLQLPALSLGAWETFGGYVGHEQARGCIFRAFNLGITHFDLANVYGTPPGRAETIVGRALREMPRDEIVVATKAGMPMWEGPYGEGSSRKSLLANIDQSLQRLELDYVDIFYSHRMDRRRLSRRQSGALSQIVRQGKALYVGLSNYSGERTRRGGEDRARAEARTCRRRAGRLQHVAARDRGGCAARSPAKAESAWWRFHLSPRDS
jgi:aryl-alcohol dehydrogenase-like predicted oxidoreductase